MKKKEPRWYQSKWAKRLALLCVGAALGALCAQLPDPVKPACVAVVKVLHNIGVP